MNRQVDELIRSNNTFALFAHINSDGDANGSVMAFKKLLDNMGKKTFIFIQPPINPNYYFLGANEFSGKQKLQNYDVAISLDCPSTKRFGDFEKEFFKAKKSICVDHHLANANFSTVSIVDSQKSSTCEMLYNLFIQNGYKIDNDIATCLYSGIATDTGRFSHSNTTYSSMVAGAELVKLGANLEKLNYNLFNLTRLNEFRIFRKALDSVEFYEDGKIAFVGITQKMLEETKSTCYDTFRIADYLSGIENVDIAVLMTESKQSENLVSVRTKISSAESICKSFGGGGHLRASGCRIFVP